MTDEFERLTGYDPLRALAAAVLLGAVREFRGKSLIASLDAALWLADKGFELWAELAEIDPARRWYVITGGRNAI